MARNRPRLAAERSESPAAPPPNARPPGDPRARRKQRDLLSVGILTPALLVGVVAVLLIAGQTFYPDPYVEPTVPPLATRGASGPTPTPVPVVLPIDTARLNAGIVDKPPAFEWPEVDGLKIQTDPGRPNEHADYTPELTNVDTRRLILASTVSLVLHSNPAFVQPAVEELAKPYPLRATKPKILDIVGLAGYVPDESTFAVVFAFSNYRIQIETVAASPPIKTSQRADIEYHTLHLADHILRRLQETTTAGRRTGPEWTAVHWRDHLVRGLPFGG